MRTFAQAAVVDRDRTPTNRMIIVINSENDPTLQIAFIKLIDWKLIIAQWIPFFNVTFLMEMHSFFFFCRNIPVQSDIRYKFIIIINKFLKKNKHHSPQRNITIRTGKAFSICYWNRGRAFLLGRRPLLLLRRPCVGKVPHQGWEGPLWAAVY
jgi:hypothetical protein